MESYLPLNNTYSCTPLIILILIKMFIIFRLSVCAYMRLTWAFNINGFISTPLFKLTERILITQLHYSLNNINANACISLRGKQVCIFYPFSLLFRRNTIRIHYCYSISNSNYNNIVKFTYVNLHSKVMHYRTITYLLNTCRYEDLLTVTIHSGVLWRWWWVGIARTDTYRYFLFGCCSVCRVHCPAFGSDADEKLIKGTLNTYTSI